MPKHMRSETPDTDERVGAPATPGPSLQEAADAQGDGSPDLSAEADQAEDPSEAAAGDVPEGSGEPALAEDGDGRGGQVGGKHGDVPEYQRKSRRMRRVLLVIVVLLVVLMAALGVLTFLLVQESQTLATQQAQQSAEDVQALQQGEANDAATQTTRKTDVPNLVALLGMTQDEAIASLAHGATVSGTRSVNEEGNPVKSTATVTLAEEPADTRTGTPTVYLSYNEEGRIVRAGYSAGTSSLGYGSLSFSDAVENEHIVEKTLTEAGLPVAEGAATLPESRAEYSTYASDGTTLVKENCSFSGTLAVNETAWSWEAVLLYDYTTANTTGNLADTIRQIYVYVGA